MGNRPCTFCHVKSSEDEEAQLNDDEILAHPYQSAEDLTVQRHQQYSSAGSNSNVALRADVSESDPPRNRDTVSSTIAGRDHVNGSSWNDNIDAKGDAEQANLCRQFEQLDVSQLQTKSNFILDYSFLVDEYSVNVIQRSRVLLLLRGPSGCGKSTIANAVLAKYGSNAILCSADDYFMRNGIYRFDSSHLREAHEMCQNRSQTAALSGCNVIVIDNTNIKRWESSFYIKLARDNDYVIVEVLPKTAWKFDPDELCRRSKHNVPRDLIQKKLAEFESLRILYWAWFINIEDCQLIRSQAEVFFVQCQTNMREFSNTLQTLGGFVPGSGPVTSSSYYRGRLTTPRSLHCTAFYCGGENTSAAKAYSARECVIQSLGRAFRLIIIGLYITPRTLGVRVYLQQPQAELFDFYDVANGGIDNFSGADTDKAHVTLAFAHDQKPAQTGYDQLELIECEATMLPIETCMLNGASAKNYGDGRCVVSFDTPIEVDSIFSAAYASS